MAAESTAVSSKTLFVGGLPYSTSDAELEELFSDFGPVKTSFTVKEPGKELAVC
jgi:RNA recognition motif-containing protein